MAQSTLNNFLAKAARIYEQSPSAPEGAERVDDRAKTLLLDTDKDWLLSRIERRFDGMLANGVLEEVRANLPGWDPTQPSAKAIGAPELVAHLQGQITLDEARDRAVISSRQYAKRQRTWFRARMGDWTTLTLP